MYHTSLEKIDGVMINRDINERTIKLLASRYSDIKRDKFSVGVSIIDPGKLHEEHSHAKNQEMIVVLAGEGLAKIAGEEFAVKQGSIIGIEEGEPHAFTNTGAEKLMLLWIYDPPGAEERFVKSHS